MRTNTVIVGLAASVSAGLGQVREASIIPSLAAIANAVYDAGGVRMRRLPMPPASVLRAIQEKRRGARG